MKNKTAVILVLAALASCTTAEQRLAAQRDKDPQYQYEKAVVCMNAGLTDEALKYLSLSLSLDPNASLPLNLRGLALLMKGRLDEAIASFEKCIQIAPGFSDGHNNLATALQEKGDAARAEEEFRRAFALDQNYNASFNLAKISYQQGKPEEALDYVQRSIRKYPRSLLAYNLQGLIYEALNKLDDAIASYEAALRAVPDEPNVEFNMAVAYYKKNDYEKTKSILEKAQRQLRDKPLPNPAQDVELKKKIDEMLRRIAK